MGSTPKSRGWRLKCLFAVLAVERCPEDTRHIFQDFVSAVEFPILLFQSLSF